MNTGGGWSRATVITANSRNNHGYVRRPLVAKAPFELFWCDGDPGHLSASQLYFGTITGEVYRLPYRMYGKTARVVVGSQ